MCRWQVSQSPCYTPANSKNFETVISGVENLAVSLKGEVAAGASEPMRTQPFSSAASTHRPDPTRPSSLEAELGHTTFHVAEPYFLTAGVSGPPEGTVGEGERTEDKGFAEAAEPRKGGRERRAARPRRHVGAVHQQLSHVVRRLWPQRGELLRRRQRMEGGESLPAGSLQVTAPNLLLSDV